MPFNRSRYPANWPHVSHWIRFVRARGRCEGTPAHPNCRARHGQPHPDTGSTVILTTAHLDHDPQNCAARNLRALCQRCHLAYDQDVHRANAAATRRARLLAAGQLPLVLSFLISFALLR